MVGVGGVVVHRGRVLLIRRGKSPLQGCWTIPGGRVEWGETIEQAVVRELEEETGLQIRVGELIEVVERIFDDPAGEATPLRATPGNRNAATTPQFHYVILDYYCETAAGDAVAARAGGDAAEIAWASEDELLGYNLTDSALRVIRRAFALAARRKG